MGIVNLTPDSFSGDGLANDTRAAITHAELQLASGAHILDVGAESSRPGATPTPEDEELRRLLPVIRELAGWGVPISVDTYKPTVMRAALDVGASIINDIGALRAPGALDVVANSDCGACLMHMQRDPQTMQVAPTYGNVVSEVSDFLESRVRECERMGIESNRLMLDPGYGFGKSLEHNITLFRQMQALSTLGCPLLIGVSRKSMLGGVTGRAIGGRVTASVVAAVLAAQKGAKILRVHDVAETRDALSVLAALGDNNCD